MATFTASIRQGLPRHPGGDPWPPAGDAPAAAVAGAADVVEVAVAADGANSRHPLQDEVARSSETAAVEAEADAAPSVAAGAATRRVLRRGLPRVPGGEPWPPAGAAQDGVSQAAAGLAAGIAATAPSPSPRVQSPLPPPEHVPVLGAAALGAPSALDAPTGPAGRAETAPQTFDGMRRGLPRVAGGEPWPPPGLFTPAAAQVAAPGPEAPAPLAPAPAASDAPASAGSDAPAPAAPDAPAPAASASGVDARAASGPAPAASASGVDARAASVAPAPAASVAPAPGPDAPATAASVAPARGDATPLPFTRTVWEGRAARTRPEPKPEPRRIGPFTRPQWAGLVIVGGGGLLYAALMAVFAVRWLLSTQWGVDFLAAYPGEYHLPEGAPVGFPAWLGWQHFFNVFLMVLIIRSGLQVRTEKRPSVFWTRRGGDGKRKISLNLWFHQSLDILWLVNGVIFVVLLFVTGQWMRIVPTSWEVFPNAISAALQYVSLDWPTENGWVNYNSLQQLAYFATVFIAAPLAAITGVRMSGVWPKNATRLSKAYPVEWARAVHFPVMLYFVLFIFVHVVLVFATGALRNLNHMYAAQGSTDPDAYAMNWTGFWIFSVSILVIVAAWIAARPLILAPIARLFGRVSSR